MKPFEFIRKLFVKELKVDSLRIGDTAVTATATELNKLDGVTADTAELNKVDGLTSSPAELNILDGAPALATISVGVEGTNAITVGIQLKDADGANLAVRGSVFAYLSNDANGDSIATTAPSGHVAIGTDGLAIPLVTDKAWMLTSEANGHIDLVVTEAGAATWYLILRMPNGRLVGSTAITFAA